MTERSRRPDALISQLKILEAVWNMQIYFAEQSPDVPFEKIGCRISHPELAKLISRETRTVERYCGALARRGLLERSRTNPREIFVYRVQHQSLIDLMVELSEYVTLLVDEEDNGMIEVKSILPRGTKF